MTRSEKEIMISDLGSEFSTSDAIIVADYKGLTVKKLEELRRNARENDIKVRVIKNTLAAIALKNSNKDGLNLKDANIFIWGNDQIATTKVAAKFEEKNEFFSIKSAFLDGEVTSSDKVRALSKMPSREELIAMLLQVWNAPVQNFTIGLNALKEKKEQE